MIKIIIGFATVLVLFTGVSKASDDSKELVRVDCKDSRGVTKYVQGYLEEYKEYATPKGLSFSVLVDYIINKEFVAARSPVCSYEYFKYTNTDEIFKSAHNAVKYTQTDVKQLHLCGPGSSLSFYRSKDSLLDALISFNVRKRLKDPSALYPSYIRSWEYGVVDKSCVSLEMNFD